MEFLKTLLIVVEVFCCLMLIGLVLLQKSKSEGLGMAFGAGAGESLFGARAGNVLSKATVILGIVFMANTLVLGLMFSKAEKTLMDNVKSPAATENAAQPIEMVNSEIIVPEVPESETAPVAGEIPVGEEIPAAE